MVHEVGGRVRSLYGTVMTVGATPREAVGAWLLEYGEIFADGSLELVDFRDISRRQAGVCSCTSRRWTGWRWSGRRRG